ncbi:MAG: YbaK/EbsC family protein [Chloroflexi bacterium]|nr:YbaK/EbsC family protein [Chloroflexota bacterium]
MSVDRVRALLNGHGLGDRIVHLADDTRTAALAAAALGTEQGAIVKSLVLIAGTRPALALVSGDRRVDLAEAARLLGTLDARMASAAEVKRITGFAIGGIPPVHTAADGSIMKTLLDRELFRFADVWAAAGSAYDVFPLSPRELAEFTGAEVATFTQS